MIITTSGTTAQAAAKPNSPYESGCRYATRLSTFHDARAALGCCWTFDITPSLLRAPEAGVRWRRFGEASAGNASAKRR